MSGPKSARYTLTPEQRRILAEARERERKTQKENEKFKVQKTELIALGNDLKRLINNIDFLAERTDTGKVVQAQLRETIDEIEKVIGKAEDIKEELEHLEQSNRQLFYAVKRGREVKKICKSQWKEFKEELSADIEDSVAAGMSLQIEEQIVEPPSHTDSQRENIKALLDAAGTVNLNDALNREMHMISKKAAEISDDRFMDNFLAMTVTPFLKKCRQYGELFEKYGEEFEELTSKHRYYSSYLELPITQFVFSSNELEQLREDVKLLEQQYEQLEEQRYISESFNEVMRDMGYHVVGSREVTKKSGRKYRNELYSFSEGTAVNVTYASNGQICVELGGIDVCDREPTDAECNVLCDEMTAFCNEFPEIEKRLLTKGVVLASRISMLPPVEEYAQIINIEAFDRKEEIENMEAVSKRRQEYKKQTMRKE